MWPRHSKARAITAPEYFFRKASKARTPSGFKSQVELALHLKTVGKQPDSQALFLEVLESLNNSGTDLEGLKAIVLQNLDRYREADSFFKKATAKDPMNFDIWIAWGDLYLEKYNPADAATIFADVLKRNPNHPDALVGLALSMSEGRAHEVEQVLERALQINPNLEKAYAIRAHYRLQADNYQGAESDLKMLRHQSQFIEGTYVSGRLVFCQAGHPRNESGLRPCFRDQPLLWRGL